MDHKIVVEIPLQSDRYALMGCSKWDGIQLPFWGAIISVDDPKAL
jgi:hypothetical protein